ncbi:MAG: LysR family transcriptional regulator [Hyphomicrobiaceae bacterium]
MEMHQVRYFLAVSRALNFTRAAEECHVAQPSLTRAIKQLEQELGSELFRRERNLTHMTDFGQRMLPHLQQCYASAATARELASSLKTGAVAPLSIALSTAINLALLVPHLKELVRAFEGLELRFVRGAPSDAAETLKKGDADIAIAGPLGEDWDRFESWPLFTERFCLVVNKEHPLAKRSAIEPEDLAGERLLWRTYCEHAVEFEDFLKNRQLHMAISYKVVSEHDLLALIEANLGVAVLPPSAPSSEDTKLITINGLDLGRTVYLYGVAGRQRSPAATALIKLMRVADWSDYSS